MLGASSAHAEGSGGSWGTEPCLGASGTHAEGSGGCWGTEPCLERAALTQSPTKGMWHDLGLLGPSHGNSSYSTNNKEKSWEKMYLQNKTPL